MIRFEPFTRGDFERLISWVDSKELLATIAGTDFTFPLTAGQLSAYLNEKNSGSFNVVDSFGMKVIGHVQIVLVHNGLYKIDKLLIGDKSTWGQGFGRATVNSLLLYLFEKHDAKLVELNVFDWNVPGIKCYENCGFTKTSDNPKIFNINGNTWSAYRMTIDRARWLSLCDERKREGVLKPVI